MKQYCERDMSRIELRSEQKENHRKYIYLFFIFIYIHTYIYNLKSYRERSSIFRGLPGVTSLFSILFTKLKLSFREKRARKKWRVEK